MKTLKISKGGLSITEQALFSPVVTIGRSPACDVVLRAFGVLPVHFLLEWVGVGFFNKDKGRWILFDISHHDESKKATGYGGNQGVVVSDKPLSIGGFQFSIVEDSLALTNLSGGMIHERVSKMAEVGGGTTVGGETRLLEVIRVNSKEQTVTDVSHHVVTGKGDGTIPAVPELKIKWSMGEKSKITWAKGNPIKVFSKGSIVNSSLSDDKLNQEIDFQNNDFLCFDLQNQEVYLRYVEAIKVKPAEHDLFRSTSIRIGLAAVLLSALLIYFMLTTPALVKVPEIKEPPRIARVEVLKVQEPEPVPVPQAKPEPTIENKKEVLKKNTKGNTAASNVKVQPNNQKKRAGLNSPSAPANVNSVGLLGALKNKSGGGATGDRVSADMILNRGLRSKSVTGSDGKVLLSQAPAGEVDLNSKNTKRRAGGSELGTASTTLNTKDSYNLKSASPIAGQGGRSDFSVGTGEGTEGTVLGGQKSGMIDVGGKEGFSTQGGLDKEAVRLTLLKYRRQIRTCYDKALLASPHVGGRIVYQWYISPKGPVTSVILKSSEAKMPALESCVQSVIKSAVFPTATNGQPTIVIYPFVFQKT